MATRRCVWDWSRCIGGDGLDINKFQQWLSVDFLARNITGVSVGGAEFIVPQRHFFTAVMSLLLSIMACNLNPTTHRLEF